MTNAASQECPSCSNPTFVKNNKYACTNCSHEEMAATCEFCNETFPESKKYESIEETYWCSEQCVSGSKKSKGCD